MGIPFDVTSSFLTCLLVNKTPVVTFIGFFCGFMEIPIMIFTCIGNSLVDFEDGDQKDIWLLVFFSLTFAMVCLTVKTIVFGWKLGCSYRNNKNASLRRATLNMPKNITLSELNRGLGYDKQG